MANTEHPLAIVIPAYKSDYLRQTLMSIESQTCKRFNVYIGDDASPENLETIVANFRNSLDLNYVRFNNNVGKSDLVSHWNRCIDLVKEEKWIWFFSDDDIMSTNCVESFYNCIHNYDEYNILRFNVNIIDSSGSILKKCKKLQSVTSVTEFFYNRTLFKLNSYGVEYIFRKDVFNEHGRFQNFDLAWCSDDATWIKLGLLSGIKTIDGPIVKWRLSKKNISSIQNDESIIIRKARSNLNYILWFNNFIKYHSMRNPCTILEIMTWSLVPLFDAKDLPFTRKLTIFRDLFNEFFSEYKHFKVIMLGKLISKSILNANKQ